jgi:hypothetical protein
MDMNQERKMEKKTRPQQNPVAIMKRLPKGLSQGRWWNAKDQTQSTNQSRARRKKMNRKNFFFKVASL